MAGGRFEEHRSRLRAVAYRMLGSLSEADDAVQEAWLRLSRTDHRRRLRCRRDPIGTVASAAALDTRVGPRLAVGVEPIRFTSQIRFWNPERASGLAVVDVPAPDVEALGGLKQQRVHGTIGAVDFVSNVMPAGGSRLALSVSRAMMTAAGVAVGDVADVEITAVGRG